MNFITGGAGFIGSNLWERVGGTVYDIKQGNDVLDDERLTFMMRGHDTVFHLAASNDIAGGFKDTGLDIIQGTLATWSVLEAMRVNGINRIVYSSSASVYGDSLISTPEDVLLKPMSLYAASKVASEALIRAYCNLYGMQAWIYRFGNVTGKGQTHAVLFDFIKKLRADPTELEIWGDGTQKRCFLLVQDCVDGMLYGMRANEKVNVFNLGVSSMTDIFTVAEILCEEMGVSPKFKYVPTFKGDVPQVSLNVDKMARLGWKARCDSTEAVRQAVKDALCMSV